MAMYAPFHQLQQENFDFDSFCKEVTIPVDLVENLTAEEFPAALKQMNIDE